MARVDVSLPAAFPIVSDPSRFPVDNVPVLRNGYDVANRALLTARIFAFER